MRTTVAVVAIFLAAVIGGAVAYYQRGAPPHQTSVREILADQDWFDGRTVIVSTSGMQSAAKPGDLVYRRFAGQAPALVVEFAERPVRHPTAVQGRVRKGNPVVLTDCRPVP